MLPRVACLMLVAAAFSGVGPAWAQPGSDGYDWATVGAVGNEPWRGFSDPISPTYGRGGVDYEYKIGRTEVTTLQWLEFFNAALARPDPLPMASTIWWGPPVIWGATRDTSYTGPGVRYRLRTDVADAGMLPVSGITWRQAAVLCNWLHNNKSMTQAAFTSGAYNVSTFTPEVAFPTFDDQRVRSPGARYWIPNLDEYMKAAFYDPNKNGPGVGGWWTQPNGSDTPLIYAPPPSFGGDGTGQANAGFSLPGAAQYRIPLAAYPNVRSPFGLLDLAGATKERLEDFWLAADGRQYRLLDGTGWGTEAGNQDLLWTYGQDSPHLPNTTMGVRIASIPTAGVWVTILAGSCVLLGRPKRRSLVDEHSHARLCRISVHRC